MSKVACPSCRSVKDVVVIENRGICDRCLYEWRINDRGKRAWVFLGLVCLIAGMFILVEQARARPSVPPDVFVAVRNAWHERSERIRAFDVIACETGGKYNTTAENGQFLGLFQMGSWARSRYGHGETARAQARAAYRYWRESGWAGWSSCA